MIKEKKITIDGYVFVYKLHIKKIKNIILKIENDGSLLVSANAFVPQTKIDEFLNEKISWILKQQQKQMKRYSRIFVDCMQQQEFYIFNQLVSIVCVQSNQNSLRINDNEMIVYYKHEREECNKTIHKYLRQLCEQTFMKVVQQYVDILKDYHLTIPKVKYRKMKARWGSCATNQNTITLNIMMIHYPYAFLEYVVLHELVHFLQPNHSKQFYKIVSYYMPDYKERMKLSFANQ